MRINYQEFKERYESSGQTQAEFAKKEGISPSMVSYYLRRAREQTDMPDGFAQLSLSAEKSSQERFMEIKYSNGTTVQLPI